MEIVLKILQLQLRWLNMPLAHWIEKLVDFVKIADPFFDFLATTFETVIGGTYTLFSNIPPLAILASLVFLAWYQRKSKGFIAFLIVALLLMSNLGLWDELLLTFSIVLIAVMIALLIGIPIGILIAHSRVLYLMISPLLDFMQTIPPYVYLLPAVAFFGLGTVPGMIATLIFILPVPIRLTYLGIIQIPKEIREAGQSFGPSPWQMLFKVEIPNAIPSIMMGVTQSIMLALSMVVLASMIGAKGLGFSVLMALNTLRVGKGFIAGLGIVILAIIFDRLLQFKKTSGS